MQRVQACQPGAREGRAARGGIGVQVGVHLAHVGGQRLAQAAQPGGPHAAGVGARASVQVRGGELPELRRQLPEVAKGRGHAQHGGQRGREVQLRQVGRALVALHAAGAVGAAGRGRRWQPAGAPCQRGQRPSCGAAAARLLLRQGPDVDGHQRRVDFLGAAAAVVPTQRLAVVSRHQQQGALVGAAGAGARHQRGHHLPHVLVHLPAQPVGRMRAGQGGGGGACERDPGCGGRRGSGRKSRPHRSSSSPPGHPPELGGHLAAAHAVRVPAVVHPKVVSDQQAVPGGRAPAGAGAVPPAAARAAARPAASAPGRALRLRAARAGAGAVQRQRGGQVLPHAVVHGVQVPDIEAGVGAGPGPLAREQLLPGGVAQEGLAGRGLREGGGRRAQAGGRR